MELLTKETFKSKVFDYETHQDWKFAGTRPAIVDFYADWCGPCRAVGPVLEGISKDYAGQVDVYKINVDQEQELAALFGVRGIPTLLFIPMQGAPQVASGALPRQTFDAAIKDVLKVEKAS
jgi:thioredoxin